LIVEDKENLYKKFDNKLGKAGKGGYDNFPKMWGDNIRFLEHIAKQYKVNTTY
jgi:hypothetical protein